MSSHLKSLFQTPHCPTTLSYTFGFLPIVPSWETLHLFRYHPYIWLLYFSLPLTYHLSSTNNLDSSPAVIITFFQKPSTFLLLKIMLMLSNSGNTEMSQCHVLDLFPVCIFSLDHITGLLNFNSSVFYESELISIFDVSKLKFRGHLKFNTFGMYLFVFLSISLLLVNNLYIFPPCCTLSEIWYLSLKVTIPQTTHYQFKSTWCYDFLFYAKNTFREHPYLFIFHCYYLNPNNQPL